MLAPASVLEQSNFPPVAAGRGPETARKASPERLREFDDVLPRVLPRFRRIAMRWLRNPEDAEDAVQDAMLSAFRHIARFDGRSQMSTWLTAIVLNAVRMRVRRCSRKPTLSLDRSTPDDEWSLSEVLADPRPTPEQAAEQSQLQELFHQWSGSLPASQRSALRLRIEEDLTIRETAEALGVPQGTVKARLARGRARLIQRFQKAEAMPKTRSADSVSAAQRKACSSARRPDREEIIPRLTITALGQGGYQAWAGA
jgi:RNA polymerase sigma-70 factor (ECF subfamily)